MHAETEPLTSDAPLKRLRDYGWLAGVWAVVALFVVVTVAWSHHVGVPVRDPGGSMFVRRLILSLGLFAVLALADAVVRLSRRERGLRAVARELRRRWSPERLVIALSGLLAYHVVYLCYHNLKSWVVFNSVHDDQLLRLDKWIFFGHSPAILVHDVLGQNAATFVLAIVYESFSYMVPLSFVAAMVFPDRIRDGYVFLMAVMWAWILGVGSYYLIPSLGPFASAAKEFAGLPHTFIADRQATLLADRAHLLSHPAAGDAFASIGAFASLHVGFTFVVVLMLRYYGFRRATQVMSVYLVATVIATIYLGYHFVIDDAAGFVLGYLAVLFGRLMIYPRGESRLDRSGRMP